MKRMKYLLLPGVFIAGFAIQTFAQDQTLPEVTVVSRNYKYLKAMDNKTAAQPVRLLEQKAAAYDVKNSDYYQDDYDEYSINFYLPNGYILAVYDSSGKLLRTAERFKNVGLPAVVRSAVVKRYPNWSISNDTYLVTYEDKAGADKVYKMVLENGNKRMRVKANDKGEILD